ncbi:hypothetical protein [Streptomyces sp. ISL-86]|uniref:hypothetical protein n=1 Tax=Streptomyces sp. ISL-86 TaxID=2819187 RepID=UPI001BE8DB51|nr:hypothetical protein [Streptomyces sp. ISL-86]MBT2455606.1 hypothetical protein [Streptomyces sp. ISL-86]
MPGGSNDRISWGRWLLGRCAALATVLLLILFSAAGQVDAALGRIEAPAHPSSTLGGLFTLAPGSDAADRDVRTAWCVWFRALPDPKQRYTQGVASDPETRVNACLTTFTEDADEVLSPSSRGTAARALIRWYIAIDVALVALYSLLLLRALRVLARRIPTDPADPKSQHPTSLSLLGVTRPWHGWVLVGCLVAAEAVEDTCQYLLSSDGVTPGDVYTLNRIAGGAALVKWGLVILTVLLLIVLVAHTTAEKWPLWRETLPVVRLQLVVSAVLLLLLSGLGADQVPDALLGLLDRPSTAVATPVAVFVLSLLLWRSIHRTALTQDRALGPIRLLWVAAAAAVFVVLGFLFARNLLGLGAVLVFVCVLCLIAGSPSRFRGGRDPGLAAAAEKTRKRADMITGLRRTRLRAIARLLAGLPLVLLGTFAVRSAVAPAIVGPLHRNPVALVILGLLGAATGVVLPSLLEWAEGHVGWAEAPTPDKGRYGLYFVLAGVCGLVVLASVATLVCDCSWNLPAFMGPVAVATMFLCVVLVALNELQRWSERATPMAGFRALGLERTPVFVLLLVWFLMASRFDSAGHHDVRVTKPAAGAPALADSVKLKDAFQAWASANCATTASSAGGPATARAEAPVPLVIVAASGGGIRAAYWTRAVLDKLFPAGSPVSRPADGSGCTPSDGRAPVFAVSGISGGSLGAVSWLSQTAPGSADHVSNKKAFDADHLSGALAWMTFVDLPRAFIGFEGKDRAAVLEQSWERRQPELKLPFYETWLGSGGGAGAASGVGTGSGSWTPLALLNGTAAESGCRVLTAPVQLGAFDQPAGAASCARRPEGRKSEAVGGPTLLDLRGAFLCGTQDVRRSTAALLSARFPYITPSGRLTAPGEPCASKDTPVSVVDGGYVEATGSLTATDLLEALNEEIACHNRLAAGARPTDRCVAGAGAPRRQVQAVLVQIDNGYNAVGTASPSGRTPELVVPPKAQAAVGNTKDANARQRAFKAFGCPNYLRFANVRGPGAQAPLGWVLSQSAQADLEDQLAKLRDKGTGTGFTLSGQLSDVAQLCKA